MATDKLHSTDNDERRGSHTKMPNDVMLLSSFNSARSKPSKKWSEPERIDKLVFIISAELE